MVLPLTEVGLLVGFVVALTTLFINVYKSKSEKRKTAHEGTKLSAEAAAVISTSAVALLEPMRQEMANLEKRLRQATSRADHLQRLLDTANADLREANRRLNGAMDRIEELENAMTRIIKE